MSNQDYEEDDVSLIIKPYDAFRSNASIRQIFTDSFHFRLIIYQNGSADICRAKGNLQSVINPNHEDFDKSAHVSLSLLDIDQAAINNNQFIVTT